ncbi:MAG: transcription termination/antitermination protein NusG [Muribaculum sp.]|nr:transcription termination/antitermination protein NusG [Muribaculum sp.]
MAERKFEWYVLRAISGKEAKVKEVLDAAIKNTDLGKYVSEVLIPTEKVYVTRSGKKVVKDRTLFSGYVFVKCILTGEVQYELRNTSNVIDFLRGRAKNSEPESLRESEVMNMLGAADALNDSPESSDDAYFAGEAVKVISGPFSGFSGVIKEVSRETQKLKVEVKIFGRPTDLELEYSQVERE